MGRAKLARHAPRHRRRRNPPRDTRHRRDDSGPQVDLADGVAVAIGDVQVAGGIELQLVRHVQCCSDRRPAIAAIAALAGSRDRRDALGDEVEPAHALTIHLAEVQSSVRADREAERCPGFPIAGPGRPRAEHRVHRRCDARHRAPEGDYGDERTGSPYHLPTTWNRV